MYLLYLAFVELAAANVEKTIFVAPPETLLPSTGPSLSNLCLQSLYPPTAHANSNSLHALLPVVFPSKLKSPQPKGFRGAQSWFILTNLTVGQRYEARVCWSATVS